MIEKNSLLLRKPEYQGKLSSYADIFKCYYYDGSKREKELQFEATKKVLTTAECSEDELKRQDTSNCRPP